MDSTELLLQVVKRLLVKDLSAIEKFVIKGSLLGKTYNQMSEESNYGSPHLKDTGSRLWLDLSQVMGERVSKKNLKLVLVPYLQEQLITSVEINQKSKVTTIFQPQLSEKSLSHLNNYYVERPPIEDLAYREIEIPGCVIRICAPRKMGKSSLLAKILVRAQDLNYFTAKIDLADADLELFDDLDRLLRWFCLNISRVLGVSPQIDLYWDRDMGSKISCQVYLERHFLAIIDYPLVLVIENLDRLFEYPKVAQDFLPMLRSWHEQSKYSPTWQKLRLVILHSTEIYVPPRLHQSPFNIGLLLKLPLFNFEQAQELALRYELEWMIKEPEKLKSLFYLVGGHPYLLSLAFHHLSQQEITLEESLDNTVAMQGVYSRHLRGLWSLLQREPKLMKAWQQLLNSEASLEPEAVTRYKLQSLGLIIVEEDVCKVSCQLYRLYFQQQFTLFNTPALTEQYLERIAGATDPRKKFFIDFNSQNYLLSYLETQWQNWMENAQSLSLILCDIEYFRFYSQVCSSDLVTKTIEEIAQVKASLISRHESNDFAIVLPTDFAIVLPNTELETTKVIVDNIRKQLQKLLEVSSSEESVIITDNRSKLANLSERDRIISIGIVSFCPSLDLTPTKLIIAAKHALAESKQQGNDSVIYRNI